MLRVTWHHSVSTLMSPQPVMKFAELASEVQVQRSEVRGGAESLGLPAGRRRANILFREVRRNMMKEGLDRAKVSGVVLGRVGDKLKCASHLLPSDVFILSIINK